MADEPGAWAAGLLIDQAWADHREGRYQASIAAAARAVEAARLLHDPVYLVKALAAESASLKLLGDHAAALACNTEILGLAEDPATRGRLDDPGTTRLVASAHSNWVECAQFVPGIPARDLFGVLDAAERWLAAIGHREWRAAILSQRATVHSRLGEAEAAVAAAEEALSVATLHPRSPGYSLAAHRYILGDLLRFAGRASDAVPHYQAILADSGANSWSRRAAHVGLAWCALAADDPQGARREAHAAVLLAESLGDDALCVSCRVLAEACRSEQDLEAAWQAANRSLEAGGRMGGPFRLYDAIETAIKIALDRADFPAARRLIGELHEQAVAQLASTGSKSWIDTVARLRRQLDDASAAPDGGEYAAPVLDGE